MSDPHVCAGAPGGLIRCRVSVALTSITIFQGKGHTPRESQPTPEETTEDRRTRGAFLAPSVGKKEKSCPDRAMAAGGRSICSERGPGFCLWTLGPSSRGPVGAPTALRSSRFQLQIFVTRASGFTVPPELIRAGLCFLSANAPSLVSTVSPHGAKGRLLRGCCPSHRCFQMYRPEDQVPNFGPLTLTARRSFVGVVLCLVGWPTMLVANIPPERCDNRKCPQTLRRVPWGANHP